MQLVIGIVVITASTCLAEEFAPTDLSGRTLNLDFETGTLEDWTAEGKAFEGQPINVPQGFTVHVGAAEPDVKQPIAMALDDRGRAQTPVLATKDNAATLFNGKDLTGWTGNPDLWSVENGEIVGKTTGLKRNEWLVSDLAAEDFHLTLEVKLVDNQGNSGIQFRSEALPDGEVKGYQADIGAGWWGKLYEEHGRALLWDKSGEKYVKKGDWNKYEIIARGSHIVTKINGHTCVDLDDPKGARRGIFAPQLHSGGATEVRFRNLKLEVFDDVSEKQSDASGGD